MPRKARIDAPGAIHHITCRGIEGRNIFGDDADRNDFLQRLDKTVARFEEILSIKVKEIAEKFTNQGYERMINVLNSQNSIIRKFKGGSTLRQFLKKRYNHSMSYFLRPLLFW